MLFDHRQKKVGNETDEKKEKAFCRSSYNGRVPQKEQNIRRQDPAENGVCHNQEEYCKQQKANGDRGFSWHRDKQLSCVSGSSDCQETRIKECLWNCSRVHAPLSAASYVAGIFRKDSIFNSEIKDATELIRKTMDETE